MKRVILALAAVAALAIGTAAITFAQTPTPQQGWGCWGGGANGSYDPAASPTTKQLADKLGISAGDLVAELKAGKSVADVARAKNVDLQGLVELLQAPHTEMMKIQVQYGYLTQEQADAMQGFMADRIRYQLEQKGNIGYGWGHGMMGGFGGMMGGFGGMMGPGFRGSGFGPRGQGSSF